MFDKFPAPDFPKWAKVAVNQIVNWPSLPSGSPTNSRHATSKGYVDSAITTGVASGIATANHYILLQDQKATNTHGGTFTSGAWQTRTLNTEVFDTGSHCSLSSNQFTLDAGTYIIMAMAPGHACSSHKARLRNITDSTTTLLGNNSYPSTNAVITHSVIQGIFTIASSKTFEIQHWCTDTRSTDGLGVAGNIDSTVEVYTTVELRKVA